MCVRTNRLLAALVLIGILTVANAADAAPTAANGSDAITGTSTADAASIGSSTRPHFRIRPVDDAWRTSLPRNADAATQTYLDRLPVDVVKRSNAYFEGGYWLQLWNFLLGLGIAVALMTGQRSARMRDWAQRVGRKAVLRDAVFGALYAAAAWILSLPLTIYQGYVREHQYAMATQTFGPWFAEQLTGVAVSMVGFALLSAVFYAVLRRAGERW